MCKGARERTFKNMKTIAECLADELMAAADGNFVVVSADYLAANSAEVGVVGNFVDPVVFDDSPASRFGCGWCNCG